MHQLARIGTGLGLAILLLACQGGPSGAPNGPAAARVGDEVITVEQLDAWIKEEVWKREFQEKSESELYETRFQGLERMVTERLLAIEAESRGTTMEDLVRDEVLGHEISEEQIQAFYMANQANFQGHSITELRPRIRQHLQRQKGTAFLESLRAKMPIEVLLTPPRLDVAATGPALGPDSAPVTIVEFSDFECPFCRKATEIVKQVRERYPDEVRVVFRHFPLESLHPNAQRAAEAANCAGDQDRFWAYHDVLFEHADALEADALRGYATEVGLDVETWDTCMAERRHQKSVEADAAAARELGLSGTPAFFVNGIQVSGAKPLSEFVRLIDAELAKKTLAAAEE